MASPKGSPSPAGRGQCPLELPSLPFQGRCFLGQTQGCASLALDSQHTATFGGPDGTYSGTVPPAPRLRSAGGQFDGSRDS